MSPIKDFCVAYEALNEEDTFSEGDTITGTVTFTLTKETKVKGLVVKAKGDANVHWSEGTGDRRRSYFAHRRYFKVKEDLVAENKKGTELPKGVHCFKFSLKIPHGDMPSSFHAYYGRIFYRLEAKLSRSWRMPSTEQTELKFVARSFPSHQVVCPQSGSVDKKTGVFSKGQVELSASINTNVCSPGDTLSIVAKIRNSSSKETKPKFSLQQRAVFRAIGSTKWSDQSLCKMIGDTIAPDAEETVSCQMKIPADAIYTLHNCEIISVDFYLKVYLDISFAIDPVVEFPLVIVPSRFATLQPGEAVGPYPPGAAGAPSYSDFPPPAFPIGPYPVPAGSGAYGYPAPDPIQHSNTNGWNNQWPQQPAPYGFSPAASFSVQHPAPTAPEVEEEKPPSYRSLLLPFSGLGLIRDELKKAHK